jgi:hypothetical protein
MRPVAVTHRLYGLARQIQAWFALSEGLEICPLAGIAPNDVFEHLPRGVDPVTELGEDTDFEGTDLLRRPKEGLGEAPEHLVVEDINLWL